MIRPVFVEITGTDPQGTRTRSAGPGTAEEAGDGSVRIRFREEMDGVKAPLSSRLLIRPGLLELEREGELACRLAFRPGETCPGVYRTPYGDILLETVTEQLRADVRGTGGAFAAVRYGLVLGNGTVLDGYRVSVRVLPSEGAE